MSDPILTDCPQCLQSTYVKQVTAAGFQLKGTGWYVTDFRDNNKAPAQAGNRSEGAAGPASSSSQDSGGSSQASTATAAAE